MKPFEHYIYILECGDGSLYTGYTTDVEARVSAHQAGTGAKYTKSHAPVRLIAQARFYSKERAMSAEAHFKQLDRAQKDALLAKANDAPLEDILRNELPGFGEDTASEFVCRSLEANVDLDYRAFHSRLVPNVDPKTIAGIRTPALRKIAKELAKRDDANTFLRALPHRLFDENPSTCLHDRCRARLRQSARTLRALPSFVDNWATCDQLPTKVFAKRPGETLDQVKRWLASDHCYTIRFAMGILMRLYLDELFEPRFCEWGRSYAHAQQRSSSRHRR